MSLFAASLLKGSCSKHTENISSTDKLSINFQVKWVYPQADYRKAALDLWGLRPGSPASAHPLGLLVRGSENRQARSAAILGDLATARKHYQDAFAVWKDADGDIPLITDAKAEYARLGT